MSTGVSSLDFPILNFKAFVKKKKKGKKKETKLGTWKIYKNSTATINPSNIYLEH